MSTLTTHETETRATADVGLLCHCGETLAPDGICLNVGACSVANRHATRDAARTTIKAPIAFTLGGRVD